MTASLPWFRLYHRIIDDEKIRLLAFEDRWHYIALCCLKAEGLLDEPDSDMKWRKMAVKMGVQTRELGEIARRLNEVELVDESMNPVAWDALQYVTDNGAAQRMRAYRQRKKASENKGAPLRNALRPDTDTDTDTDKSSLRSDGARAKGSRLPDDWEPSAQDCEFAKEHGLTVETAFTEARKFRDYWIALPGQKGRKADWSATWRNWIRRAAEQRQPASQPNGQHRNHEIIEAFAEIARGSQQ